MQTAITSTSPALVEEFDSTAVDAQTYEEGPVFNSLDPVGIGRAFRFGRAEIEVDRAVLVFDRVIEAIHSGKPL